ncbi:MAG: hypothetical protein A2381_19820 [Bdellovibrionales bacterium RIFOXYB1_FULL_37_110]|nr:MAG: hypothetical protein A2181_03455 [Bdellovibrionales bacterium RIFOXYA1_FULL_38_20]OFZ50987.1 MAG: hypothetical protein A2417_19605 [Bdellovibrionales bacterium RIFOXYC1_FULL_37_79]OFZ60199.1 MAG: hypothetical protein A2381_19820 [Bdellovibrionales bacterium RIFOXYB1_FULL_37_110]
MNKIFITFLPLTMLITALIVSAQNTLARIPGDPSMGYHQESCQADDSCEEENQDQSTYAKIKKHLLELDLNFSIDLLKIELLEGIDFITKYRYDSEPSYHNGYYTRIDKWDAKFKINAGELLENIVGELPFGNTIQPGKSIIFVRQYKDQLKARTALPINPILKLPRNAKIAQDLEEGTFVSMQTYLNLITRIGPDVAQTSIIEAEAGALYLISGEFTTQIFKLANNRIRLKAIYNTSKGPGLYFKIDLAPQIDIASGLTNDLINNALDFELFEASYDKEKGYMLAYDYFLDLSYPEVQKAYNAFIKSSFKFAPEKAKLIFGNKKQLITTSIANLEPIHEIFMQDIDKPQEKRRVDKKFEASNDYQMKTFSVSFDTKLFELKAKDIKSTNYIVHTDQNEIKSFYQFDTFSKKNEFNLFFSVFDRKTINDSYVLYQADQDEKLTNLDNADFGISLEKSYPAFSRDEQLYVQKYLLNNLPRSIYKRIEWNKIISLSKEDIKKRKSIGAQNAFYTTQDQKSGKFRWQIHFHKSIFDTVAQSDDRELDQRLSALIEKYIGTGPTTQSRIKALYPTGDKPVNPTANNDDTCNLNGLENYKKQFIKLIRKYVNEQGDSTDSKATKNQYLARILNTEIFQNVGIAFLSSFISEEDLENLVTFNLMWTSKEVAQNLGKDYTFAFGKSEHADLFNHMTYLTGTMQNRSFDLRLVGYDVTNVPDYKHWLDDDTPQK